jgi:hypothetical protein
MQSNSKRSPELTPLEAELLRLVERAHSIRHPNFRWTKAETERSWLQWDQEARISIAKAKGEA